MVRRLTTAQFLEQARAVHGNRYNYDRVDYKGDKSKILIGCNVHGYFEQSPATHKSGSGCKQCFLDSRRKPQDKFIKELQALVPEYNLSEVIYTGNKCDILVTCGNGHRFITTPNRILRGSRCMLCQFPNANKTLEQAIADAIEVHGTKYKYDCTHYHGVHGEFRYECMEHGIQKSSYYHHVQEGKGCKQCSGSYLKTTEQFILDAVAVHGSKYDYSHCDYKGNKIGVDIICTVCGNMFQQTPNAHLRGDGCSSCTKKKETEVHQFLIQLLDNDMIIRDRRWTEAYGNSRRRPDFRIPSLQLVVEYDGEGHFQQVGNWKPPEHAQMIDTWKMIKAVKMGYSVLRIHHAFLDKIDWRDRLTPYIRRYERPIRLYAGEYDAHRTLYDRYKDCEDEILNYVITSNEST